MPETITYRYGAKAPVFNAESVSTQIGSARHYRNTLIAIERDRRAKVEAAVQSGGFDELQSAVMLVESIEAELESTRIAASAKNAKARSRVTSAEEKAVIFDIRARLKSARTIRKELRARVWDDPALRLKLKQIDDEDAIARKKARAECGVYWGTYLIVEDAMRDVRKGAPPEFRRWDGTGTIAAQIQNGMSIDELDSCMDTRLRLDANAGKSLLSIRIGSQGRAPVFAQIPVKMHRPLPKGGCITWAKVRRERIGTQMHWSAIFSVRGGDRAAGRSGAPPATTGAVGIDIGWRLVKDGLRVAFWTGGDGAAGELILPPELLAYWSKVEELISTRDRNFNIVRDNFAAWLKSQMDLPDWVKEECKTLPQWRSADRLGKLILKWRMELALPPVKPMPSWRPDCHDIHSTPILEYLARWRAQDRHLWNWAAHNRLRAANRRKDIFRNFTTMLSRRYATAYVEDTDWAKLAKLPKFEDEAQPAATRVNFRIAAVGGLIEWMKFKMHVVEVPARNTTRTCHACGHVEALEDAGRLMAACPKCLIAYDQDENASRVILDAGLCGEQTRVSQRNDGPTRGCGENGDRNGSTGSEKNGTVRRGRFTGKRGKEL